MINRLFIFLFSLLISISATAEQTLVLARAPQLSPSVTSQKWTPFVKDLAKKTGVNIILKVYKDRTEFEGDIKNAEVDLYFGNPGYGVVGHIRHGYIPLIRSERKLLEGIVVVRKDSGIEKVNQLDGKTIAYSRGISSISLIPSIGGTPRKFVENRGRISTVAWSPDGRRLARGRLWLLGPRHHELGQI